MTDFDGTTRDALRALTVLSTGAFAWFGEPFASAGAATVTDRLQHRLYSDFYVHGVARPSRGDRPGDGRGSEAYLDDVRGTTLGRTSRQPGWTVTQPPGDGGLVVTRDGLRLWLSEADVVTAPPEWTAGATVTIRIPAEQLRTAPGYYLVLGEADLPLGPALAITRVYWNIGPEGAAKLVRSLSDGLDARGIPFRLKVCNARRHFDRADSGVLYLPDTAWPAAEEALAETLAVMTGQLPDAIPAYTRRLAAGVGVAQDDGAGGSFGLARCALVAAAAVAAARTGVTDLDERVAAVRRHFTAHGLDPDRPHLRPGGVDRYRALAPA